MRKRVQIEERDGILGKECSKCSEWKALDDYTRQKTGLGGRLAVCKACKAEYMSEYRNENYAKELERQRKWNKENAEHKAEKVRNWKRENRDQYNERHREWYENNKEKHKKSKENWRNNNPEKIAIYNNLRRTRNSTLPNDITAEQYTKTLEYFENACAFTGVKDNIEMEHAIPIVIGHGGTTFGNVYPMTKSLNASKYNNNIFEWFNDNKDRFNLSQERFDSLIDWLGKANGMTIEEYRNYVYWCHANPRQ